MKCKSRLLPTLCTALFLNGCSAKTGVPQESPPDTGVLATYHTESPDTGQSEPKDADMPDAAAPSAKSSDVTGDTLPQSIGADERQLSVTYDYKRNDSDSAPDGTIFLTSSYMEPKFHLDPNAPAAQIVKNEFDRIRASYETDYETALSDAKSFREELGADAFFSFGLDYQFHNIRDDGRLLSIRSDIYANYGGPHGNMYYSGINFDLTDAKKLTLSDIATDKDALLQSAHNYIAAQLQLPRYQENLYDSVTMDEILNTIDSSVLTDDKWYFTKSGITFIANTYEIGPHAAGAQFFQIPFEKLNGLNRKYTFSGAYMLPVLTGTSETKDLNSDGTDDCIFFDNPVTEDGEITCTLKINDMDYTDTLQLATVDLHSGVSVYGANCYYLVDLDESDAFTEIALANYGENDYFTTHFFRYDGSALTYLGTIYDVPESFSTEFYGDGTLSATAPLNLLETRRITMRYGLTESGVQPIPQDWYTPHINEYAADYNSHKILKDVTVHTKNSLDSDTVILTSLDGPVRFPATDNDHWYMVETKDKTIYYLYLTDFSTTEDGQLTTDVFENLLLAG